MGKEDALSEVEIWKTWNGEKVKKKQEADYQTFTSICLGRGGGLNLYKIITEKGPPIMQKRNFRKKTKTPN